MDIQLKQMKMLNIELIHHMMERLQLKRELNNIVIHLMVIGIQKSQL